MKLLVVAAVFLVLTGLPLATALIRSGPLALAAAPTCSGLVCAFAGMACLATGTALRPWVVAFTLLTWVVAAEVAVRRRPEWRVGARSGLLGWLPAGLVAALMAPVLAATTSPPVEWDARAIWWFHGLWFWQGGDAVARAMANPAFSWSHQDYPPLYPASSGALWTFYDPADRALAKALGSGLTFGAVLLIACVLVTLAPRRLRWPAAVAAGLLGMGLFGIGHGNGTAGHVDLLWAASYGAAALALLVAPARRDMVVIGALSAMAAALTKNEAVPAVLLLIVLFVIRHRAEWRRAAAMAAVMVPTVLWSAETAHFFHGQNDSLSVSGLKGLLLGDHQYTDRVPPTLSAMWHQVGPTLLATLAITAVALLGLGRQRRRQGLGSFVWLPLVTLGVAASFLLIYATGPHEVHWWLFTSIDRTMIVVRLMLVVEVAVWLVVGLSAWLDPHGPRQARRVDREARRRAESDDATVAPERAPQDMTAGSAHVRARARITNRLLRPY
jgi:hypothetical protein